jgi:hypothetical protein
MDSMRKTALVAGPVKTTATGSSAPAATTAAW